MSFEFLISKIQKNNFLLIGRAGIDIYPDPPGTKTENAKSFVTHLGGSSANMGVQLTLFGGNCNLLTRVSDDALGKLAINQLNHYGVKNKLVKFEKNETRISFAIVETTVKDHQSIIYRHKASDLFLNKDDIENADIQNFDCVLITGTSLAAEPSRSATLYALDIANKNNIPVILMHMQGTPKSMQKNPFYHSVIDEISTFFKKQVKKLDKKGFPLSKIILDPGIGFGKNLQHNYLQLLHILHHHLLHVKIDWL